MIKEIINGTEYCLERSKTFFYKDQDIEYLKKNIKNTDSDLDIKKIEYKKDIFLHIPHSSEKLPKLFFKDIYKSLNLDEKQIKKRVDWFLKKYTDIYVKEIFLEKGINAQIFNYSRLFCDVERFKDNSKEEMFNIGQGYLYTSDLFTTFRDKISPSYQKFVDKIYDKYHKELKDKIKKYKPKIIVDCHTFWDKCAYDTLDALYRYYRDNSSCLRKDYYYNKILSIKNNEYNNKEMPDICLGFNENNKKISLIATKVKDIFNHYGFKVAYNYPYSGALEVEGCDLSLMIEVNRKCFIKNISNNILYGNSMPLKEVIHDTYLALSIFSFLSEDEIESSKIVFDDESNCFDALNLKLQKDGKPPIFIDNNFQILKH